MKTAIVYDRVNKWGGAERVLLVLNELFPDAPLYTSLYSKKNADWASVFPKVIPSFLQKFPLVQDRHEYLAPLMPLAFEYFNFSDYDLVISVTSEAAKGIVTKPQTKHICLCLTPTRYLWSHHEEYFKNSLLKVLSKPIVKYLKNWDFIASQRPDRMISISTEVKNRIKKYYKRDSEIIYPPVETNMFKSKASKKKDYFLIVSRLVPYKKVDLVIEAFNELGYPLFVVGTGSQRKKLENMARENVRFLGHLTDKDLAGYYQGARAFFFPQEEDFGITAVEAQAAGTPVIAYGMGGAKDTVVDGVTGLFFDKQEKSDVIKAVRRFEKCKFNRKNLVENAERFSKDKFKKQFRQMIDNG